MEVRISLGFKIQSKKLISCALVKRWELGQDKSKESKIENRKREENRGKRVDISCHIT